MFLECKGLVALDVWLLRLWASQAGKLWVGLMPHAEGDGWNGEHVADACAAIAEMAEHALSAAGVPERTAALQRRMAKGELATVPLLPCLQLQPPAEPGRSWADKCLKRHRLEAAPLWQVPGMRITAGWVHHVSRASAGIVAVDVRRDSPAAVEAWHKLQGNSGGGTECNSRCVGVDGTA